MVTFRELRCFLYVFCLMNLASCSQISGKKCLAMSRKLEFDNYAPMETKFRIQVIFDIQRHECVHKCLTHGNECASVIVNDYCCCWLLRCYMNSRFVQKGFLVKWIGWHYYANDNACRPGWDPYNGHCYFFESFVKDTRTGASYRCNDLGGYLVKIENGEENTWLTDYYAIDEINVTDTSINRHYKFAVWIGAISSSPTEPYRWELSGPTLDYQPWYPGEPSLSAELCVTLLASGIWNDIMCDDSFHFVCESDLFGYCF